MRPAAGSVIRPDGTPAQAPGRAADEGQRSDDGRRATDDEPRTTAALRLPFTAEAVPAIAEELGVPSREAAYQVRGQPVFELKAACAALPGARLLVVLWPSLARVDARLLPPGAAAPVVALTRKQVVSVEIYRGIEVMFRRRPAGFLFVSRQGIAAVSD